MALNLPTFYKRTGSAIVFAVIMLTGLLWNEWAFLALISIIEFLCFREYVRLMKKTYPDFYWPEWLSLTFRFIASLVVLCSGFCFYFLSVGDKGIPLYMFIMVLLRLLPAVPVIFILVSVLSSRSLYQPMLVLTGGLLYLVLPIVGLLYMRKFGFVYPLALILMIWSNDTLAYLVGSFIGKTPFSPISPKKTWEGTIGGALLTMIGAGIYGFYAHQGRLADWVMLALCATVAGTLGDLLESKLKRMADVKDSGSMMPGHGGALDRFDSLLVAAPFALVYFWLFMELV